MNSPRNYSFVAAFFSLCLVFLLVACGQTTPTVTNSQPTLAASTGQPITLTYAIWDANQVPAMEQIAAEFKKKNPNITVVVTQTPNRNYWTKLDLAINSSSELPDVLWMNSPRFGKYAAAGALMPIDPLIKADNFDMNNYPPSLVTIYTWNGQHYGIPKDFDTIGLWYNKTLFDTAGLKYPDESWDWNTLKEAAKKLTQPDKGIWGIAAWLTNQETWYNTVLQSGGYVISDDRKSSGYDKPETIEGLKFWVDLIKAGYSPDLPTMQQTSGGDLFKTGKVAMLYDGSWSQIDYAQDAYTKDKVDVAVLPQGKKRATVIHGLGNVVSAKTKYPREAWEFVKFLGSKEAAEIQAKTGTVMPAFKDTQTLWVKSNPRFNLQIFVKELDYAYPYPASKSTAVWLEAVTKMLTQSWLQMRPVEDAAKELARQMNTILADEQK